MTAFFRLIAVVAIALAGSGLPAHAYIGPGMSFGVLAVVAGVVSSFFLAVFAVVYYPIKRRIRGMSGLASEVGKGRRET